MEQKELIFLGKQIETTDISSLCLLPEVLSSVQAGFASAADEYIERYLDVNELVVKNRSATFFVRVQGDSMEEEQIRSGDILVVDRSLRPTDGKIVVAIVDGEFTVKKLGIENETFTLYPANPKYSPKKITGESDFRIWGVVTYVISAR
jgi:DNA polymerase V